MIKKIQFILVLLSVVCLSGCGGKVETLEDSVKKIELTGDLVTYQTFYHNVIEYEKKGDKIFGVWQLEKDRRMFFEYTGTLRIGVDLSKVKITATNNEIFVCVPEATIIGEPNIDKNDFKEENIIESKDNALLFKNPITADDLNQAFNEAQQAMKEAAQNDSTLLENAKKRAQVLIEENIKQFIKISENEYKITWECKQ